MESTTLNGAINLAASIIALLTVVLSFTKKSNTPQTNTTKTQSVSAKIFRAIVLTALIVGLFAGWVCDAKSLLVAEVWSYSAIAVSVAFLVLPFFPSKGDIWIFVWLWVMTGAVWLGLLAGKIDKLSHAL